MSVKNEVYWRGAGVEAILGLNGADLGFVELHDDESPDEAFVKSVGFAHRHFVEGERIIKNAISEAEDKGVDIERLLGLLAAAVRIELRIEYTGEAEDAAG